MLINISLLLFSIFLGFCVGIIVVLGYMAIHYHNKGIRQYGFSEKYQQKKLASDRKYLKQSKKEHANTEFK